MAMGIASINPTGIGHVTQSLNKSDKCKTLNFFPRPLLMGAVAFVGFGLANQVERVDVRSIGAGAGHVLRMGITFFAHIHFFFFSIRMVHDHHWNGTRLPCHQNQQRLHLREPGSRFGRRNWR